MKAAKKSRGLSDPFFGRGELIDYTGKPIGFLEGKGDIAVCPKCGKRGVERKLRNGNAMYIHSDQMVSMCGILCNEIKESCFWKSEVGA